MAVFTIQGPDGKTYRVQGNDQAGAINFLKSQIGSQQNAAPAPTAEVNPDGTGVSRAIEKGVRSVYTGGKQFQANILSEKVNQKTQPNAEYLKRALMLRGAQIPPGMDPNNIDVDRVMQFNVLDLGKGTDWRDDVYKFAGLAVKNRDEYFQSGEEAQDFSKLDDLSQEIASQNQKMRDLVRSPGAQNAADRWEAAPDVKSALKSLAVNPLESVAFFGELAAESIPSIAAGSLATLITGNPTVGAGVLVFTSAPRSYNEEVNSFLTENGVDTTDPQSVSDALDNRELMSKANSRGLTKAAIVSAFEALGMKAGGGILKQSVVQGFTGGAGEGVSTKVLDGEVDWKDVWLEGLAELATAPAEATILRNKKGQGTATKEERVQNNAAAASLAQRLRTLSQNNSYNLKDVKKDGGAKQTLESAHEAITGEMKAIVTNPAVKGYLDPKQAKTLEELIDKYAKAQIAIRQTRNKVKSKVDQENYDAILNALPPSKERDQIANLMRESNVLTDLFRSGTKGGVSSFTDTFNPFAREDGSYDPSRMISAGLNKGTAILSAGASLPTQFGIVAGGRTIDAVTRRRAAIDRFVRKNEGKTPLQDPTGPSLVEAEAKRQAQADQLKFEDDQMGLELGKLAQSDKDNSPVGTVLLGTGLDRDGLRAVMSELEALNPDIKALKDVFTDIRKNMDGGNNKIRRLDDIIPIINHHLNTPDTTVQRQANPDQLLAQRAGVNMPNVDQSPPAQTQAQTAAPGQPQGQPQSGNQFTTPENYQAGKSDNNAFARNLESKLADDTTLAPLDKAQLATALADMQASLGPNPVEAMTEIVEDLGNMGVSQEAIDTYVKPYADRVIAQQARVGRLQSPSDTPPAAPTVDQTPAAPTAEQQSPLQQAQQLTEAANSAKDKAAAQDSAKVSDTAPLSEKLEYVNSLERLRTTVLAEGAARKITEGNMDPASVEAMLNQLEQNNPGIKAKILDITGPQQQSEDRPRFARIAPVPFNNDRMQQMFGVEDPTPGGNYIDLDTKEDLTGNTYAGGKVSIVDGKPVLDTSDDFSEPATKADGRKVKVNLFKQKAGWKWIDYDGPATIVSTEVGGKHHYALSSDFQNPVTLQTYPNQPSEPRLRPTTQGEVELGNKIGNISVRGKIHPVYDEVRIVSKSPERPQVSTDGPLLSIPEIPRGESTNIQMPNQLGTAFGFAKDSNFAKGRDLKLALQEKSLAAQKEEGVDLTELSTENVSRLADHVVSDALEALKDNSNAIGWYDRTVTDALSSLSEIYPEIQTNPVNKLQFIWALAVTSNGTKVDKNFELAANAYDTLQRTGRFPTNIGIGEAAKAINGGLQQYHTMLEKFERQTNSNEGDHQLLADFMNSQVPVKQIEQEYDVQISGEGKNTLVRGASILGPKIGNGFFSNLYGNFDALTMDRWLMRTVGRMRGSLVKMNPAMEKKKRSEIKSMITDMSPNAKDSSEVKAEKSAKLRDLRRLMRPSGIKIGKTMSNQSMNELSAYVAKQSTSKDWRESLNQISPELRKAANSLAKYRDGQVEAPAGAKERDFIRSVFTEALGRLNSEPTVTRASNAGLTMSDLQALLWYPEKRLYDTAKAPEGQESRGYADDEAPDYANAARKLVEARKAMAVGGGLGSTGAAGPRGRGPVDSDARFNQQPTGVAGILAQRIQGSPDGPIARGAIPDVQEVKGHANHARALVEIGKPGSDYENGIKDQRMVEHLAKAVGVTLKMFNDHNAMLDDGGFTGENRKRGEDAGGVYMRKQNIARSLAPGAKIIRGGQVVRPFKSYLTALHEVAHGIAGRDIEGNLTQNVNMGKNYLTGNQDAAPIDTLEHMIGSLATMPSAKKNKIIKEIMSLQDNESFVGDGVYYGVRPTGPAKQKLELMLSGSDAKKQLRDRIKNFEKYSRSIPEFTVDPLIVYLQDPKKMKSVAPETAKAIRAFFVNSSKIRFYSHPLAMAFAVVMAMLMKQEQAEEEERQQQQMPPGALNQPMPQGMLSA